MNSGGHRSETNYRLADGSDRKIASVKTPIEERKKAVRYLCIQKRMRSCNMRIEGHDFRSVCIANARVFDLFLATPVHSWPCRISFFTQRTYVESFHVKCDLC